jgi:hypothetical protein
VKGCEVKTIGGKGENGLKGWEVWEEIVIVGKSVISKRIFFFLIEKTPLGGNSLDMGKKGNKHNNNKKINSYSVRTRIVCRYLDGLN